jgi:hypothetical protein
MICKSCAWGAHKNEIGDTHTAQELHAECKGCDCQHKTGSGWTKKKPHAPHTHRASE